MNIIARRSGGRNIVARPQARPAWYPPATVDAHEVEIFMREIDPDTGAFAGPPQLFGRFPAAGKVPIPNNPDSDRDVVVYLNPLAADGTPGFSDVTHATQVTVLFRRETAAPVIGLTGEVTDESAEIGITGFSRFARKRRVTISANADMSDPVKVLVLDSENYVARELPRYFVLSRFLASTLTTEPSEQAIIVEGGEGDGESLVAEEADTELPPTVYVTIAHSGGAAWTPESDVLEVAFAPTGGTGGSSGDFDPTPRDGYRFGIDEV